MINRMEGYYSSPATHRQLGAGDGSFFVLLYHIERDTSNVQVVIQSVYCTCIHIEYTYSYCTVVQVVLYSNESPKSRI